MGTGLAVGQYWERTYGGLGVDRLAQVAALPTGDLVAVGSTGSFGPGGGDAYVLVLDEDGAILRSCVLGGPGVDAARAVAVQADGMVVAGTVTDPTTGDYNIGLWGMDLAGALLWERSIATSAWELGIGITAMDGGWVVLGHSYTNGTGDVRMDRLTTTGEVMSTASWGGEDDDVPAAIAAHPLGGLLVTGTRRTSTRDVAFLVKFNGDLGEDWAVTLPSDSSETAHGVTVLSNGDILVSGSTREASDDLQLFIARFTSSGDQLWKRVYGQIDDFEAFSAVERTDGGLAVIGYTKGFGLGGKDVYLLLAEPEGWFQQGLTFGTGLDDEGRSICTTENGFLLGGTTDGYGPGPAAFHLIRTNAAGSTEGAQVNTTFDPVDVAEVGVPELGLSPNPMRAGSELTIEHPFAGPVAWRLTDAAGRHVAHGVSQGGLRTLHLPAVGAGLYTFHLYDGNGSGLRSKVMVVSAP